MHPRLRAILDALLLVAFASPVFGVDTAPPADVVPFAGLTATEACEKASLPPGFAMHAFAAEPDVVQPIAFCLDHRGRVWVAEGRTYPKRKGHPPAPVSGAADRSVPSEDQLKDILGGTDRILVLEDTDGDHRFDRKTVFLENVNLVSGLEVGFGGVWIGAAPYLLYVPVADGDVPKPAGRPRILLDGWNYSADTHETLNTFTWGPDGWLYGAHGVFCPSNVGRPGAAESDRQWMDCGVWRYHPTRHVFEVFAEGGSNPWGVDFDEMGQCWMEMCVIPHLNHMIQGARYERQGGEHFCVNAGEAARNARYRNGSSRKPVYPFAYADIRTVADHVHWAGNAGPHAANARSDAAGGGHAHAGLMCYLGAGWPAEYRGQLFIGNIHGQRLNVDVPVRSGSGYIGRHGRDFLNFNDSWSQTLNQLYDQDGSVYIIDWYDKNQCHHGREDGHDRSNGRIYKVVYRGQKPSRIDVGQLGWEALVDLVPSKNEFLSRHARRVIQERIAELAGAEDAGDVPPAFAELVRRHRAARKIDALSRLVRLVDESADTAARLRALWALHGASAMRLEDIARWSRDPDEWVRAWMIQLFHERDDLLFSGEDRVAGLLERSLDGLRDLAAGDPSPVVRRHVTSAALRMPVSSRGPIVEALLRRSEDAGDWNLPLMYWYALEPLVAERPEAMLGKAVECSIPRILQFTARRIASLGTTAARDLLAARLRTVESDASRLAILTGLAAALDADRSLPMPAGWKEVESALGTSPNADVRAAVLTLSLKFGSPDARKQLRQTLADGSASGSARRVALESLLTVKDAELPGTLRALLADAAVRGPAIRALAGYSDPETPSAILAAYASLDPGQRRDAVATLVSRPAYAMPLLRAMGAGTVPVGDLSADNLRQLRGMKDPELQQQLVRVYGAIRDVSPDKKTEIEKYRGVYRAGYSQPGDGGRGRVLFNRLCAQCHSLFDVGGKVGPDITGANRGDINYLLETIVDPNAVIPNEYRATEIELKDGRLLTGIVKSSTDGAVVLQTANEILTLRRDEIAIQRQSELSMMPEGLLTPLSDQEVRDLLYYISRPGQVPLPATSAGK